MEPPWDVGMKVCLKDPGHMTNMAAMPVYGKNLKNLLLRNQRPWNLERSIRCTSTTKFVQMMTLDWP